MKILESSLRQGQSSPHDLLFANKTNKKLINEQMQGTAQHGTILKKLNIENRLLLGQKH